MSKLLSALLLSVIATASVGSAFAAEGQWARNHPRREQVNDRLANHNQRPLNQQENTVSRQMGK